MAIVQHFNQTRLYTSALLHTILDDITVTAYDTQNGTSSDKKVPLFATTTDNRSSSVITKEIAKQVPCMTMNITGIERNIERQRNKLIRRKTLQIDDLSAVFSFNDIPYDIRYDLAIYAPNQSVMFNIIEHILSFFHDGKYYMNVILPLYADTQYYSCPVFIEGQDIQIEVAEDDLFSKGTLQANISFVVKGIFHSYVDLISYNRAIDIVKNDKSGKTTLNDINPLNKMTKHSIKTAILSFINCDVSDKFKIELKGKK